MVSNQNCESVITKRINISVSNAPKGDQIWLIHPAYFSTDYFTYNFITSNMTWLKWERGETNRKRKKTKLIKYAYNAELYGFRSILNKTRLKLENWVEIIFWFLPGSHRRRWLAWRQSKHTVNSNFFSIIQKFLI